MKRSHSLLAIAAYDVTLAIAFALGRGTAPDPGNGAPAPPAPATRIEIIAPDFEPTDDDGRIEPIDPAFLNLT